MRFVVMWHLVQIGMLHDLVMQHSAGHVPQRRRQHATHLWICGASEHICDSNNRVRGEPATHIGMSGRINMLADATGMTKHVFSKQREYEGSFHSLKKMRERT